MTKLCAMLLGALMLSTTVHPTRAVTTAAIPTQQVADSVGINTHIDFAKYGYENIPGVAAAISFLGIKHLRDCANKADDGGPGGDWTAVHVLTGAKFDDYMIEGSPAAMAFDLSLVPGLAAQGLLELVEGGNEEDDAYAVAQGNSIVLAQQFQKEQVWPTAQALHLPVILESFGSGWSAANNWNGDYDKVGDMSAFATYGNAHTYPSASQKPAASIARLNADAKLAAPGLPVITTEIGYGVQSFGEAKRTDWLLDSIMDGIKLGDVRMYIYALYDDASGQWGVMNTDGTPRKSGQAIHNLMALLTDNSALHDSLTYTLTGSTPNDQVLVMEKTGGVFWLAVWNEVDPPHSVTVSVPTIPFAIKLFDPEVGTAPVRGLSKVNGITFDMPAHPLLIQIRP